MRTTSDIYKKKIALWIHLNKEQKTIQMGEENTKEVNLYKRGQKYGDGGGGGGEGGERKQFMCQSFNTKGEKKSKIVKKKKVRKMGKKYIYVCYIHAHAYTHAKKTSRSGRILRNINQRKWEAEGYSKGDT